MQVLSTHAEILEKEVRFQRTLSFPIDRHAFPKRNAATFQGAYCFVVTCVQNNLHFSARASVLFQEIVHFANSSKPFEKKRHVCPKENAATLQGILPFAMNRSLYLLKAFAKNSQKLRQSKKANT